MQSPEIALSSVQRAIIFWLQDVIVENNKWTKMNFLKYSINCMQL